MSVIVIPAGTISGKSYKKQTRTVKCTKPFILIQSHLPAPCHASQERFAARFYEAAFSGTEIADDLLH